MNHAYTTIIYRCKLGPSILNYTWSNTKISPVLYLLPYTYLTGRLAWSRRNIVGVGPTLYKWFLPELDLTC